MRKTQHTGRTAWGRVKDIIHTRKDSLKRKNKRSNSTGDALPSANNYEDYGVDYDMSDGASSQVNFV